VEGWGSWEINRPSGRRPTKRREEFTGERYFYFGSEIWVVFINARERGNEKLY